MGRPKGGKNTTYTTEEKLSFYVYLLEILVFNSGAKNFNR
jgi:hypothetical protein